MKIHSKIAIVAVSLNLLIPTATLARDGARGSDDTQVHIENESESPEPSTTPKFRTGGKSDSGKFCTNATKIRDSLTEDTSGKTVALSKNFDKRSEALTSKRAELVKKISENRLKSDSERTRRFTELEAKAQTDAQKAAVKVYETAVLAAIAKHRAAIDAADKTFLDGVAAAVGTRQGDLATAAAKYKAAVTAAVTTAKSSCASGVSSQTVRQTLASSLKSAQNDFAATRKSLEKAKPNLDALKDAHKAAVKQANADFRAELKAAFMTLKATLGKDVSASPSASPSSSPSPSASPSISPTATPSSTN